MWSVWKVAIFYIETIIKSWAEHCGGRHFTIFKVRDESWLCDFTALAWFIVSLQLVYCNMRIFALAFHVSKLIQSDVVWTYSCVGSLLVRVAGRLSLMKWVMFCFWISIAVLCRQHRFCFKTCSDWWSECLIFSVVFCGLCMVLTAYELFITRNVRYSIKLMTLDCVSILRLHWGLMNVVGDLR